ncbi:MAG: hypothetical protein AAFV43_07460 [Planctomycetota bacterium]
MSSRFSILRAAAAALLAVASLSHVPASALELRARFSVEIESGGLTGMTLPGSVTYDSALRGSEDVVLTPGEFELEFSFLGFVFTEADDSTGSATAEISRFGPFTGLDYTVESPSDPHAFFRFTPPSDGLGETFVYELYDDLGELIDSGAGQAAPVLPVEGDFNDDGRVDNADLNLMLDNWGEPTVPDEWVGFFTDNPGVNNDELGKILNNWGVGTSVSVPEPAGVWLIAVSVFACRRRSRTGF